MTACYARGAGEAFAVVLPLAAWIGVAAAVAGERDIARIDAVPADAWGRRTVRALCQGSYADAIALAPTLALDAGPTAYPRLHDALEVLREAWRYDLAAADREAWVGAALSADERIRRRARTGAALGARVGPDGALRIPDQEALDAWEIRHVEPGDAIWKLWVWVPPAPRRTPGGSTARWEPRAGAPGWDVSPNYHEPTWALWEGGSPVREGVEAAELLGLGAPSCGTRVVEWDDPGGGPCATLGFPCEQGLVPSSDSAGRGGALADAILEHPSEALPHRPDECLDRASVAAAAERFDRALLAELGLDAFVLLDVDRPPAPAAPASGLPPAASDVPPPGLFRPDEE